MQSSIHRPKAKEITNVVIELSEDGASNITLPSSAVNLDFGNISKIFSIYQGNEECGHDQLDEPADAQERGAILMLRDVGDDENSDDDESEINFVDYPEPITYRNGILSISYNVLMKLFSLPLTLFRSPCPLIYKPSNAYNKVMAELIQLEDNGDFSEFDRRSTAAIKRYAGVGPDIVSAVTIEQALCYIYRKNLRAAEICAQRGFALARTTSFPPKFQARALTMMATIRRKGNKLGAAHRLLEFAEQNFENGRDYEDVAHFHECCGSYLDSLIGSLSQPDESIKERALASFKKMGDVALRDARPRVQNKNRFYALIKSARILLDSNSLFGRRSREVSEESIDLASRQLDEIKTELWTNIPRGSQIQFRLVKSDLYFRQGKFEEERGLLKRCLDEATRYDFKTEVPIIVQRLKEIENIQIQTPSLVEINHPVENTHYEAEGSSSSSNKESAHGNSSDSASDIFSSKYL